ncbi:AcrR family transcriptional regulator [Microbacterium resistens]|uniref:AcrR family transcriptional regulator n=1 Tax=Microbacterium resistens TaxID=156977 RepID=A0ABU1SDA7_9MICO|nr:helix-turn-helix domain-containing protein [Microbacterium resistens]MDR6867572.1 AcrR family transcriptional regulator [Microbacterium resistens]
MMNDSPVIGRSGSYSTGVARRQEILDRAIEVFAERGATGASLRQIAKAIGVSHAALLHYFDSREQLLVAVYEHAERVRYQVLPRPAESSAMDSMVHAATENVKVPGMVQLYTTLVAAALEEGSDASKDFFTRRFERTRADVASWLRADQAAGLVRADLDPDAIAALIIAASDGLQTQWLLDPAIALGETLQVFGDLLKP